MNLTKLKDHFDTICVTYIAYQADHTSEIIALLRKDDLTIYITNFIYSDEYKPDGEEVKYVLSIMKPIDREDIDVWGCGTNSWDQVVKLVLEEVDKRKKISEDNREINGEIFDISNFLKSKRKSVGLNQIDFADKCGISLDTLRRVEQGKTTVSLGSLITMLHMFGAKIKLEK